MKIKQPVCYFGGCRKKEKSFLSTSWVLTPRTRQPPFGGLFYVMLSKAFCGDTGGARGGKGSRDRGRPRCRGVRALAVGAGGPRARAGWGTPLAPEAVPLCALATNHQDVGSVRLHVVDVVAGLLPHVRLVLRKRRGNVFKRLSQLSSGGFFLLPLFLCSEGYLCIFRFYTRVPQPGTRVQRTGTLVTSRESVLELNPVSLSSAGGVQHCTPSMGTQPAASVNSLGVFSFFLHVPRGWEHALCPPSSLKSPSSKSSGVKTWEAADRGTCQWRTTCKFLAPHAGHV